MLNSTIVIKVQERLNKLASQDYDNIECWQIVEAFNKGTIEWVRRQLAGNNNTRSSAEQTTRRVDDLQVLLTPATLTFSKVGDYYQSSQLPNNYMEFNRVDIYATNDCCDEKKKLIVYLTEEKNISILLRDELKKPNFEWAETFATIVGNTMRIYSLNEFIVSTGTLMYYRKPINIEILNCGNPYTGLISPANVISEFKDDIVEVLIDNAAAILAGDIESLNQLYRLQQTTENNN